MSAKKSFFLLFGVLTSCATVNSGLPPLPRATWAYCRDIYKNAQDVSADQQLNRVSDLFNGACFREAIQLGSYVRQVSRDKFYDITAEMAEVITPEGTFTKYVLESYERAYLSVLIAMGYLHLHETEDALVELRRSQQEAQAFIYNYGDDQVLTLLQAALWDRFDPQISRPYWQAVKDDRHEDSSLRELARSRTQDIDQEPTKKVFWKIYGIGQLPSLDWSGDFLQGGTYKIYARPEFPITCVKGKSILVPTSSWTAKIASRYNKQYHPLLLAKSLARLPVGVGYGIVGVSGGVAVGIGGCGAASYLKGTDNGQLCKRSLEASGYLIEKSVDLVSYTLKPDLRHWEEVPKAFYLSPNEEVHENPTCLKESNLRAITSIYLLD